jgi:hypothetical protein
MSSTGASTPTFKVFLDDECLRAVVNATIAELMAKGLVGIAAPAASIEAEQQHPPQRKTRRTVKPNAPLIADAVYAGREAAPFLGMDYRYIAAHPRRGRWSAARRSEPAPVRIPGQRPSGLVVVPSPSERRLVVAGALNAEGASVSAPAPPLPSLTRRPGYHPEGGRAMWSTAMRPYFNTLADSVHVGDMRNMPPGTLRSSKNPSRRPARGRFLVPVMPAPTSKFE